MSKDVSMNFNTYMTHNRKDCRLVEVEGRIGVERRVDRRINFIITAFGKMAGSVASLGEVVAKMNAMHPDAGYTYRDIYGTIQRMKAVGLIRRVKNGWTLDNKARELYNKFQKNL